MDSLREYFPKSPTIELDLINDLKANPVLWDRSHGVRNRAKNDVDKTTIISNLAKKYKVSDIVMDMTLINLRQKYSRERKKLLKNNELRIMKPLWKNYENMRFLDANYEDNSSRLKCNWPKRPRRRKSIDEPKTVGKVSPHQEDMFDSSMDSTELFRLSPMSCPSPALLEGISGHPDGEDLLEFIKGTHESSSKSDTEKAAFLDYLRIIFEERNISEEKFQEFVDYSNDFLKTL